MRQISCNVIEDLLPSYLEEICSEDTKELVKEHLEECEECSRRVKRMQETQLVSEQMEKAEIDGMKKVRQWVALRGEMSFWLMASAVVLFIFAKKIQSADIPVNLPYAILPLFLLVTGFVLREYMTIEKTDKTCRWLAAVSGLLLAGQAVFQVCLLNWTDGHHPFAGAPEKVGSFAGITLYIIAAAQFVLYLAGIGLGIRREGIRPENVIFPMTGIIYVLGEELLLHGLTDVGIYSSEVLRMTLILFAEAAVVYVILWGWKKYRR